MLLNLDSQIGCAKKCMHLRLEPRLCSDYGHFADFDKIFSD